MIFSRFFGKTRKQLRKELAMAQQTAKALAHNLNNPLAGVLAYLEMIGHSDTKEEMAELATKAYESAERMKQIIKATLETKVSFKKVDFGKLVDDILRDLHVMIKENNAKITYGQLPTVVADYAGIYQVVQNLITNAIKFCDGTAIHISAEIKDRHLLFSVRDAGIGIPNEKLKLIFEEGEHNEEFDGYGVGLASCRQIIDANGGKIWAESSGEDQGITIYFTLPMVK